MQTPIFIIFRVKIILVALPLVVRHNDSVFPTKEKNYVGCEKLIKDEKKKKICCSEKMDTVENPKLGNK